MLRIYQPDPSGPPGHAPAAVVKTVASKSGKVKLMFMSDGSLAADAAGRRTHLDAAGLTAAGVWGFVKAVLDGEAVSPGLTSRK
jgi:hypothetical protein